jgi:hypothetical protein
MRGGQRLVLGAEVDGERQSEVGGHLASVAGRGENNFSFGPTARGDDARAAAACVARGADVGADRQHRCEVAPASGRRLSGA